ncbi:MAG: leucine-rich repeat domain-containing protein [Muribaculaceae bacterium]|nr:leucine-rich repeat domain-containing protein [Muribaculaceae bacterium]
MRKFLLIMLGLLMTLPAFAHDFQYTYEGQTITYRVMDEDAKTCKTICAGTVSGTLILPENPQDGTVVYSLTTIDDESFAFSTKLTSVKIPSSVIYIGANAFCDSSLTSLIIPTSVNEIGCYAFANNKKLISVLIPPSVTQMDIGVFSGCSNLKKIAFPNILSPENFFRDDNLEVIKFPYDPTSVTITDENIMYSKDGKSLLFAPSNLHSVIIPEGVTTICKDSFAWSNIDELTIPASIEMIEEDAFFGIMKEMKEDFGGYNSVKFKEDACASPINKTIFIDWDKWYTTVSLGNINSNPYREGGAYIGGIEVPAPKLKEGMTEIPDYINLGLQKYEGEIELPSTLKRIGAYAFYENKEIYSIIMPEGLESIGDFAFAACELLENPKFPESLKEIGNGAFVNCTSLTEISLPEGLTKLGDLNPEMEPLKAHGYNDGMEVWIGVFQGCSSLEKAVLVADIDYLGDYMFDQCSKLNKVYFPLELKSIGKNTFSDCNDLEEITFPITLESIGEYAFASRGITSLNIPDNVKSIGRCAFKDQPISRLSLGAGLETISPEAFMGHQLKIINFSEGLKEIGESAFRVIDNWTNASISSVNLPSTLETIGENAFGYANIIEMIIPEGVKELLSGSCGTPALLTIGSGVKTIAADAFYFDNLRTLRVKSNTPPALSEAFNITAQQNDNLTLVVNNGRRNTYSTNARWKQIDNIIEESSTDVVIYMTGDYPISEEIRTTTGIMPASVSKMKVVGPLTDSDMRLIKENMVSLQSLDLSEVTNLTEIPAEQFNNSLLAEIKLPSSITKIGESAFSNCSLLQLDELPESVTEIGSGAFSGSPRITISRLPEALKTIGYDAFAHCGIRQIIGGPALEYISSEAFMGCSLLEVVDLSETALTGISDNTFSGCHALEEIILPETVRTIGGYAFNGTALRDIDFAANVNEIGYGAFADCRRLVSANLPKSVTNVSENTFANCPRLIASSMFSGVESIGANVFNGDSKLANISCAAAEAPEAASGAFDGIRLRYVSLTVPGMSFRPYLNAPQWGRFQSIQNKIPLTIDDGIEVSSIAETEYQDMLKEDALEEAMRESSSEPALLTRSLERRSMQTRAAAEGRIFASLFDGAQIQTGSEGTGTRIFINPQEGVEVTSIKYDGKEMISEYKNNSILLPAGSQGALVIKTSEGYSSVDKLPAQQFEGPVEVFDLNGIKIADSTENLSKGIYIVRQGTAVRKIVVK